MKRTRGAVMVLGLLVIAVAAWGGIVAYVGPTFDFNTGSTTKAWVWTQSHWTLHLAPAVVGIVGGLVIMFSAGPAARRLGALLTLVAGVWFVIGPTVAPLWQHGGITTSGSDGVTGSRTIRVLEGVGYHYGTGVALMLLGTLALALLPTAAGPGPLPAADDETQETEPQDTRRRPVPV